MKIMLAGQGDLPAINRIYNQAVRQGYCTAHLELVDMEERRKWFSVHNPLHYPVFVALDRDRVLGWLSLGPYREGRQALAHVAEVSYYVEEKERGKGIGTSLLDHALTRAAELGFSVLVAILLDKNTASIGLLKKAGFEQWGRMPGIARMGDQSADHLYFGRTL